MSQHEVESRADGDGDWRDDALAALFWQYASELEDGASLDEERLYADHPRLAAELIEQLREFQNLGTRLHPEEPLGTFGDYTLRRQIGRGGMGVVYEAWQGSMDRVVALKVLPAGVSADNRAFMRFMREAKTAGQLNHQNVVGVYSTGVEEGTPWYSMEYVEGETLANILARTKETDENAETPFGQKSELAFYSNLAKTFADVADGLQHAHSKGVVHRDIKPSNLILDREGRLRILDFGLARLEGQESLTISGDVVGTPLYMSPEQARRRKISIDHRTDVYSLGVTMYEALCGRPPFRGRDHADTLSQIIGRDPTAPTRLNARIPKELETIVLKCLRKEPGDRYGTAEALNQDLRRFVRGDSIEARPQSGWEKLARKVWRHRLLAAAGCLAALLLVTMGLLWSSYSREAHRIQIDFFEKKVLAGVIKVELSRTFHTHDETRATTELRLFGHAPCRFLLAEVKEEELSSTRLLEEAVTTLREARKLFPERGDVSYHLARALVLLGEKDDARKILDRVVASDPAFLPARVRRREIVETGKDTEASRQQADPPLATHGPWAKAWLAAHEATRGERWEDVEESYTALLNAVGPDEAPYLGLYMEARLGRGRARVRLKQFDGASEDFAAARERWPDLIEPVLLLGKTYLLEGNTERAQKIFEDLHERAPLPSETAIAIARVYHNLKQWDAALEWVSRIENLDLRGTKSVDLLHHRAYDRMQGGNTDGALADCDEILAIRPDDAYAFRIRGDVLRERRRWKEAIAAYTSALAFDERSLGAYHGRVQSLARTGDLDGALDDVNRAINLKPDAPCLFLGLGFVLRQMGDQNAALRALDKAIEIDPKFAVAYNDRGALKWEEKGDLDGAIADFDKSIELRPDVNAYLNRGGVWRDKGNFDKALADYEEALKLDPEDGCIFSHMGNLRQDQWEHRRSIEDYNKAIEIGVKPTCPPLIEASFYVGRATSYDVLGDFDRAIEDLNKALEIRPRDADALFRRGTSRGHRREYERAIADYTRSLEYRPGFADVLIDRGIARAKSGLLREALADFGRALSIEPDAADVFYNRGQVRVMLRDFAGAVEDFTRAIEKKHTEPAKVHYVRANAHASQGDIKLAIEDYTRTIELDGTNWRAYVDRGVARDGNGVSDEARADYHEAIRIAPGEPRAYLNLALLLESQGDFAGARENYDKAVELSEHPFPVYTRGKFWQARGEYEKAIADYTEVVMLDSEHAGAYFRRGALCQKLMRYDDALADFTNVIEIDATHVYAYWFRAIAWARKGLLDKAWADVNTIQSLRDSFQANDFYNWACVYSIASTKVASGDGAPESSESSRSSELEDEYRDKAIELLGKAIEAGKSDLEHIRTDPDLEAIRGHPKFKELMEGSQFPDD